MAQKKMREPNTILRSLRQERGWSLQRVADELRMLVQAEDENRMPGVNAGMIGVWERGVKKPGPYYQALFCTLYHRPASQLGFMSDQENAPSPVQEQQSAPFAIIKHTPQMPVSSSEQTELEKALGVSIGIGWKLFLTASAVQVLAFGQAQLHLLQQIQSYLSAQARPMLYSSIYRLIGVTLHIQERYEEALQAHQCAYIASLEAANSWHMAQNLICEANTYQALDQHDISMQVIERAVQLLMYPTDQAQLCSKAHLLACWSNVAMLTGDQKLAQKKLESSAALLEHITPNEEFDQAHWYQFAGNCALIDRNYSMAVDYFEKAVAELPQNWLIRQATTLIPLAVSYVCIHERDVSLTVAKKAIPVVQQLNASTVNKQFMEYIQQGLLIAFPQDSQVSAFMHEVQQQLPTLNMLSIG